VNSSGTAASRWVRLLQIAERRLPALTRLKNSEALPIVLDRRRIFVVPTRFGLMFSAVLLVMLLGALNYNNNPAMLLTCLLAAAAYQSVFQAFRTLDRIELVGLRAEPCHAGDILHIRLDFHVEARARRSVRLSMDGAETVFDLIPQGNTSVHIQVPALRRGLQRLARFRIYSEYPFGLFHAWSWLNPDFSALIYPQLELNAPPLPCIGADAGLATTRTAGDELAMLRDYHPTDPLRNVAWKASARHDTLLVKQFEQLRGQETELDDSAIRGVSPEARIARLARWVVMAESAHVRYALRVPGQRIGPGLGPDHRHACLQELALLPGTPA
jgi:uncharacterized protein (DUF58 family)